MRNALVLALAAAMAASVCADEVTISSSKDNTLYEPAGVDFFSNGAGEFVFAGLTVDGKRRRAVLAFDVAAAVPAGATIQAVALRMNLSRCGNSCFEAYPHALHRLVADWGQGTSNAGTPGGGGTFATTNDATWRHRFFPGVIWAVDGGEFVPAPSQTVIASGLGFYTWGSSPEMIADVQSWLDNPAANFGWILIGNETEIGSAKRFDSRENLIVANRPALTITFSPPVCCVDFNNDEEIDFSDIEGFLAALALMAPGDCKPGADFNNDGEFDFSDIEAFLAQYSAALSGGC